MLPPPKALTFTSWWREQDGGKNTRRELSLKFNTDDGSCVVWLNRKKSEHYTLSHLVGKFGPIEACDLHVGCKLSLFGRMVTLRQTDSATLRWLESEAKRLSAIQDDLVHKLVRQGAIVRSLPSGKQCLGNDGGGRSRPPRDHKLKGTASLRLMLRDIAFLQQRLGQPDNVPLADTFNILEDLYLASNSERRDE